jgi:hypothetical protein
MKRYKPAPPQRILPMERPKRRQRVRTHMIYPPSTLPPHPLDGWEWLIIGPVVGVFIVTTFILILHP